MSVDQVLRVVVPIGVGCLGPGDQVTGRTRATRRPRLCPWVDLYLLRVRPN